MKMIFPVIEVRNEEKQLLSDRNKGIDSLFEQEKENDARALKPDSIRRATFLYGPWICNFKCPKYCYTRGTSDGVLTPDQTLKIIEQARSMGAKATYWPGEGELTLLKSFWDIMQYHAKTNLPAVLFTNGDIFQDNTISRRTLGIDSDVLIDKLNRNYPRLHLYLKFWHSNSEKAAEMVGVSKYPYQMIGKRSIPSSLAKLLTKTDKNRLGVEVMVSRENFEDAINNILPTIEELDLYAYVEPVIFSGNAKMKQGELALTPEQHHKLKEIFASGGDYCEKRQSTELIVKGTMLTPGIAIPPRPEDSILNIDGSIKDVFEVFHNPYFRKMRKLSEQQGGCLCRNYWQNSK